MRLVHGFVANLLAVNIEALAPYDGRQAGARSSDMHDSVAPPGPARTAKLRRSSRPHGSQGEYSDGRTQGNPPIDGCGILWRTYDHSPGTPDCLGGCRAGRHAPQQVIAGPMTV